MRWFFERFKLSKLFKNRKVKASIFSSWFSDRSRCFSFAWSGPNFGIRSNLFLRIDKNSIFFKESSIPCFKTWIWLSSRILKYFSKKRGLALEEARPGLKKGYNIYMIFSRFNLFFNLQTSDYAKKDNSIHKINQKIDWIHFRYHGHPRKNEPKVWAKFLRFYIFWIEFGLFRNNWRSVRSRRDSQFNPNWILNSIFAKFSKIFTLEGHEKKRIKSHSCQIMADNRIQFLQMMAQRHWSASRV